MKNERQLQILKIIAEKPIETQNQLIVALKEAGVKSTQATVSRDMRELRLVKKLNDDGSYQYVCPEEPVEAPDHSARLLTIFRDSVASCATVSCASICTIGTMFSGLLTPEAPVRPSVF